MQLKLFGPFQGAGIGIPQIKYFSLGHEENQFSRGQEELDYNFSQCHDLSCS
jgi:hypothetical protein